MSAPLLLVADDLATIAAIKRVLAREGYEVVLATNAADAVIAFSHELPSLVLLQPSVETDRGGIVLAELQNHPEARLLRVVLLGETIAGFALPVEPLPIDPVHFAQTVNEYSRDRQNNEWQVVEQKAEAGPSAIVPPSAPEAWRATHTTTSEDTATEELQIPRSSESLATRLFGDLPQMEDEMARDVEASAMASVDSSLGLQPTARDKELEALEAEVRQEAMRRRQQRLAELSVSEMPAPGELGPGSGPGLSSDSGETSFASLSTSDSDLRPASPTAPAATRVVRDLMAADAVLRAEEMLNLASDSLDQHQQQSAGAHEELNAQLMGLQHQLVTERDAHRERVEALEADWLASLQKVEDLEKNARRLEADLAQLHQRGADSEEGTQARISTLTVELEALKSTLETQTQQALSNGEKAALLELQIAELTTQHEQKVTALEAARLQALQSAQETSASLGEKEQALQAALQEANKRAAHEEKGRQEAEALAEELLRDADGLKKQLAEAHEALTGRQAAATGTALEVQQYQAALKEAQDAAAGLRQELQQVREARQQQLEASQKQLRDLNDQVQARTAERDSMQSVASQRSAAIELLQKQLEAAQQELQQQKEALAAEQKKSAELREVESKLTDLQDSLTVERARHAETQAERERLLQAEALSLAHVKTEVESLGAKLSESDAAVSTMQNQLRDGQQALDALRDERETLLAQLVTINERFEASEAALQQLKSANEALEARSVVSLAMPGRRALGVARSGTVDLEGLASLVAQLVVAQADVRLELGAPGGSRTLWLRRGAVIAAESSIRSETLVDRARRDGLIDGRHETELRSLTGATTPEWLTILKSRGLLRDAEAVPLVQRYTEYLTLEAFTEPSTNYRLSEESPGAEVMTVVAGRGTLSLLAEGLRRAMPVDSLLERLGGSQAIPSATDSELDARALGFSDRERKMLSWVNSEASIEDVVLASGLKPDLAYRALLVARLLGVITVQKPSSPQPVVSADLDVRRLDSKFEEVQDADYFTILGLQRGAGTDEVRRAHARLTSEFDPIRYSAHPDAGVHQRVQVVHDFIEEAARALEDDRRRMEYARHLLD